MLYPVGDVDGMAAGAVELLLDDPRREQFGKSGREWALSRFGQDKIVQMYRRVYRRVLEGE